MTKPKITFKEVWKKYGFFIVIVALSVEIYNGNFNPTKYPANAVGGLAGLSLGLSLLVYFLLNKK